MEGAWKLYWKRHRGVYRHSFYLLAASFSRSGLWERGCPYHLAKCGKRSHKKSNAWGITEREATEDSIKRSFLRHAAPDSDGSNFQFQGKQVGVQHTGRKPWFRTKNRVVVSHNGIRW